LREREALVVDLGSQCSGKIRGRKRTKDGECSGGVGHSYGCRKKGGVKEAKKRGNPGKWAPTNYSISKIQGSTNTQGTAVDKGQTLRHHATAKSSKEGRKKKPLER